MTIKVDLLPTEKRGFQIDPLVIVLFVFVVATSGAFYYYGQTLEQQIKKIDEQRVGVEAEIKQCETAKKAIEKEREKLAKLEQQFQLVKSLMHDPLKYANLMSEVGSLLPDSVYIDNLNIDPGPNTISFSGTAAGALPLSIVAATMKNFNESAYFDGTVLQSCSRKGNTEDVFTFSMTIHFDPNAATDKPPGTKDASTAPPPPPPSEDPTSTAPATPAPGATP
ncbi:MAG: PilN domain-containing protein [Candidatus Eremiobacteraeota bacterium]|nr:PilN domain-containing protein [Candidatus Eremiobacteraeota bacterium]MCW5868237.1 PilN domain-containing protein [Candidatus Eremiobacteraeota bacterium]